MLKVPQSVLDNWPVLTMEAVGILITRALVEVVMLKMLPAVPVETLLTTPLAMAMVEVPDREMPVLAVKRLLMSSKAGAEEPEERKI